MYIGEYIGDYYRGYLGDSRSLDYSASDASFVASSLLPFFTGVVCEPGPLRSQHREAGISFRSPSRIGYPFTGLLLKNLRCVNIMSIYIYIYIHI